MRRLLAELPGALLLAITTAVVTLTMAVLLSLMLGGANDAHRLQTRCYAALQVSMMREAFPSVAAEYAPVDTHDIDCSFIYEPFESSP